MRQPPPSGQTSFGWLANGLKENDTDVPPIYRHEYVEELKRMTGGLKFKMWEYDQKEPTPPIERWPLILSSRPFGPIWLHYLRNEACTLNCLKETDPSLMGKGPLLLDINTALIGEQLSNINILWPDINHENRQPIFAERKNQAVFNVADFGILMLAVAQYAVLRQGQVIFKLLGHTANHKQFGEYKAWHEELQVRQAVFIHLQSIIDTCRPPNLRWKVPKPPKLIHADLDEFDGLVRNTAEERSTMPEAYVGLEEFCENLPYGTEFKLFSEEQQSPQLAGFQPNTKDRKYQSAVEFFQNATQHFRDLGPALKLTRVELPDDSKLENYFPESEDL